MASLKPVKVSQETNIAKPSKKQKRAANKIPAIEYDGTLNYKHNLGSKPLPEGGIDFFLKAEKNWPGSWNHRLNKTAFIAKANGWLKDEFTELFEKYAPDPKDPSCLAVIKSVFDLKVLTTDSNDGSDSKKAFRELLIKDINAEVETFHTSDQIPFARLVNEPVPNVVSVRSVLFEGFIKKCIYEKRNYVLSKSMSDDLIGLFSAMAIHRSGLEKIHLRIAREGEDVFLCLGGNSGCIRIFPNNSKDISVQGFKSLQNTKVNFIKSKCTGALPAINHTDILSVNQITNELFEKFINIKSKDDRLLLLAALVSYLTASSGDFIFLIFEGEQGSGKSTAMDLAKRLIDPSPVEKNSLPRNAKDVFLAAQHMFIPTFDNVSRVHNDVSDCLCMLSTGGAHLDRALYTNQDVNVLSAKCPVMMNGIEASPERADLLDRSVIFNIEPLSSQKSKVKMYEDFNDFAPHMLMCLVQITSYALSRAPKIDDFGPFRMTDFAKVGCAVAEYLGYEKEFFINAYLKNRDRGSKAILENDPIARQLLKSFLPSEKFVGTATQLYEKIKPHEFELFRYFPKGPAAVSKSLRRIVPDLRKQGFKVLLDENRDSDYREIELEMPPKESSIWARLNGKVAIAQRQFGVPNMDSYEDVQ